VGTECALKHRTPPLKGGSGGIRNITEQKKAAVRRTIVRNRHRTFDNYKREAEPDLKEMKGRA
jgi:hypothetical protein